jgi:hypothetical protein
MSSRVVIGGLGAVLAFGFPLTGSVGYSARFGSGGAHLSASLSPIALAAWPLALVAVAGSWRIRSRAATNDGPRWPRVLLALYVDFASYLIVAVVPACLLALWLESIATGEFSWKFTRNFARPSDALTSAVALFVFAAFWAFFGIPMWASRRSPGGLLAGVVLHTTAPVPFWRSAVFGVFQYFALAVPGFEDVFNVGGFQARASKAAIDAG